MTSIDLYEDFNEDEDERMGDYEEEQDGENPDNPTSPNKIQVEAKEAKVVKKRKLITLNAERLKGPRGIVAIDEFFGNIKLKGRGYESNDLKEIIKNLEHWAFRMFPKYNFDDSLAKIERLGRKREIAVHMTRYRMNQLTTDDNEEHKVQSDDEENKEQNIHENEPLDEFDELLNQQIALSTTTFNTSKMSGISAIASQPLKIHSQAEPTTSTPTQNPTRTSSLTDEQRKRIEENRQRAMKIREAKMNEMKQKQQEEEMAKKIVEESPFSDLLFDDDFE